MNVRTSRVAIDPQSIIDDTRTMNYSALSIEHVISPLPLQTEIHIDFKFGRNTGYFIKKGLF